MKYKRIPSAAHNFAHSFTSLLNYGPDNYVMSYLAHAAATSGEPELRVDLLSGAAEPAPLLTEPVRRSVDGYVRHFPGHLQSMNVSVDAIRRATLRVRFDLEGFRESVRFPGAVLYPFESSVEVEDDRGVVHVGTVRDEWLGDADPDRPTISSVLNVAERTALFEGPPPGSS
jgi:hypothetical protein